MTTPRTGPPTRADHAPGGSAVALAAGTAALGGLLFGFDTGIISAALLYIRQEFGLGDPETRNRTLEDIHASLEAGAVQR